MKTISGLLVACCAAIATSALASDQPSNPGFESGLDGWTFGGHIAVLSGAPYQPTEGSRLAVFNGVNSTPDGWLARPIEVRNDINRYHRLRFDVGNLGFVPIEMRLRVEITEDRYDTAVHHVDQVIAIPGISGGITRWQEASFDFPTPASGSVLLRLSDVSTGTDHADLVLDHLRLDDSAVLNIEASENPWLTDPWLTENEIHLSPAGIEGTQSATPPWRSNHHPGSSLTVTAPAYHNLKPFLRWRRNGVDYDTRPTTLVTMDADTTLVAVYDPPITAVAYPAAEARGFWRTGPFSTQKWNATITNHSGATEHWAATTAIPDGSPDPRFFTVTPDHGTLAHGESCRIQIHLNQEVFQLPPGTHYGRVDVTSDFSPVAVAVTLQIIDPYQHVENGGFESGFDGWFPLNHITRESAPPYLPTEGNSLVAFNSTNATPDGTLTRTFPTEAGVTYALSFDIGTLAYNTLQQSLQVELSNEGDEPPSPFQTDIHFVTGTGGGTCHWEPRLVHFVAQGPSTRITFRDVSTATESIDLLLDKVRVSNPDFDIAVTTSSDENDASLGQGLGDSLREAIAHAAAVPGTQAIRFSTALDGATLTLEGSQLVLGSDLAIDASTLATAPSITANGQSRVIRNDAKACLRKLRILGGDSTSDSSTPAGGGIFNTGVLWLDECEISNHFSPDAGGAIRSWGELTLSGCRVSHNRAGSIGGGLFNQGSAYLQDCSLSNNTASSCGGGLACQGAFAGAWLVLDRSSVFGNTAGACGGGYSGIGGYKQFGNLHAINSTFAGNQSNGPGAAVFGAGPVRIQHSTLSTNTSLDSLTGAGGLVADGPIIENSIIAGNQPDLTNPENLPSGGNLLGGNPRLDALGSHGGPTESMPPLAGSPAIDAASPVGPIPATDQRGGLRSSGLAMDIGAVELRQIVVDTLADETDGASQGDVSLRDAVAELAIQPIEMIRFAPTLDAGTIVLNGTPITLIAPSGVSIDASNLPDGITISGNHLSPILGVLFSNRVTLDHLTLRDAASGALHADWCALKLHRVRFLDNHNPGAGGALSLMSFDAYVELEQCLFAGNHSTLEGGAISNRGNLRILDSTFANNQSDGSGGALWSGTYRTGYVEIRNSTFSGNTANGNGGAIDAGSIQLIHSTVCGNSSINGSGGGVFSQGAPGIENGAFTTTHSIIAGNSSPDFAGILQNQIGNNLIGGDPKLAPLADFGGPTPTRPPLPGSPAIDAASDLSGMPALDQRQATRPSGRAPDLGAVEAFPFSSIAMTDTDADQIDDRLEPAYGWIIGNDDGHQDSDGDGSSNATELENMSDPLNPLSLLRIVSFTTAPGFDAVSHPLFDVTFTSFPGLSYTLEASDDCRFVGSSLRCEPLGTAGDTTQSIRILLRQDRDFVRIRRDP